jgi:hypothetical protein
LLILSLLCVTSAAGDVNLEPRSIHVQIYFEQLNRRNVNVTVVYEGENASAVRSMLDLDTDERVGSAEVNAHASGVRECIAKQSRLPNTTLDGRKTTRISYLFYIEGAQGSVRDTAPVKFTMTQLLEFPAPETRSQHVYCLNTAIGGDEPWENKAYGDDPWGDEFIGGDEPWENVFVNGISPWGNEAIGGDEPWENRVQVAFRLEIPNGWSFVTGDWPPGLADHLYPGGNVLKMDTSAIASSYASTLGRMNLFLIEKTGHRVNEGIIYACAAVLTMLVMRKKTQ